MCGRYGLTLDQQQVAAAFGVERFLIDHQPRYNIAPSQQVPALVGGRRGRRVVGLRWGLVPYWADDPKIAYRTINARSESVAQRPAFRDAWARPRRCLLLADGFYEWQASKSGGGPKRPHWIHMRDDEAFGFAGLWERWTGGDSGAEPLFTCTILTTRPNALLAPIHDRMPVILADRESWDRWIDPAVPSRELTDLLSPHEPGSMIAEPVSTFVNDPKNEGPECTEPV